MPRQHTEHTLLHQRSRRFPRRVVSINAEFSPVNIKLNVPHNIGTINGLVKNLSPSGIFVELPVLYRVGSRFQIRLEIQDKTYAFYVIVWRVEVGQSTENSMFYGHGMKITTASEDTLAAIVSYINAA
jgi:hypothetical protein